MTRYNLIVGAGCAIGFSLIFFQKSRKSKTKKVEGQVIEPKKVNEVLFFPDREFPCDKMMRQLSIPSEKRQNCTNRSCRKLHNRDDESSSLLKFLDYLASAKNSIDLCIYIFTQPQLANLLKDLASKGIRVRIITDATEHEAFSSQIERVRDSGIVVKSNDASTRALMHHKFVVVDGSTLLTGSFNWTNKAVVSNYEAIIVSSERKLVEPFNVMFEKMWSTFNIHPMGDYSSFKHF